MSLSEQLAQGQIGLGGVLDVLLKLGLVLALLLLTLALLKKWSLNPPAFLKSTLQLPNDKAIQTLATHHLNGTHSVHVLQIEEKVYVVGTSPQQGVQLLDSYESTGPSAHE